VCTCTHTPLIQITQKHYYVECTSCTFPCMVIKGLLYPPLFLYFHWKNSIMLLNVHCLFYFCEVAYPPPHHHHHCFLKDPLSMGLCETAFIKKHLYEQSLEVGDIVKTDWFYIYKLQYQEYQHLSLYTTTWLTCMLQISQYNQ